MEYGIAEVWVQGCGSSVVASQSTSLLRLSRQGTNSRSVCLAVNSRETFHDISEEAVAVVLVPRNPGLPVVNDPVMGVPHCLLLCALSVVGTAQERNCGSAGEVVNGDIEYPEGTLFGAVLQVRCNPGYKRVGGTRVIRCGVQGWNGRLPVCEERNCGSAGEVVNGDVEYPEGTLFGAVLQVRCNPGYRQIGGSKVIRCDVRGWEGRLPVCEAVVCEVPPAVEHAIVSPLKDFYLYRDKRNCGSAGEVVNGDVEYPEGTLFGAVLQVCCNPGYRRVGGTRVIWCDVQGWDGRLPVCEASHQLQCDKTKITTHIGGEFILICRYDTNPFLFSKKYWCRGDSRSTCEILVDSEHVPKTSQRFQILDARRRGLFVKGTNLQYDDSGRYWVGIDKIYADIMTLIDVSVTEVPVSKPRIWPLSSLVGGPTCWGQRVTVRCGCTYGSSIRYSWYQRVNHKGLHLHSSSDLHLDCTTVEKDISYYCIASNDISKQESEILSVQVLVPADINCIYVVKMQGQPVYDCADRMSTTVAPTPTPTTCQAPTDDITHTDAGNQSLQSNQTHHHSLFLKRAWTGVPLWYALLCWASFAVLLICPCIVVKCAKTRHRQHIKKKKKKMKTSPFPQRDVRATPTTDKEPHTIQSNTHFTILEAAAAAVAAAGCGFSSLALGRGDSLTDPVMGVTHFLLLCALSMVVTAQDCGRPELPEGMVLKGDAILQETFQMDLQFLLVVILVTSLQGLQASRVQRGTVEVLVKLSMVTLNILKGHCLVLSFRSAATLAVVCEVPPAVENANVSPLKDSYQYRDSIKYTCLRDYTLIGQASLTCSDDGTFTPNPPECKNVQCAEPVIKNGGWNGGARPPYTYKSTVILKCEDGYQMEGDGTITCEKDNNWSPQLPTCKIISTTPKATTTTTTPSTTTTTTSSKKPGGSVVVVVQNPRRQAKLAPAASSHRVSTEHRAAADICVIGFIAVIIIGVVVYKKRKRGESLTDPVMGVTHFLLLCALSVVGTAQDCGRPELEEGMVLKGDAILQETFQDGSSVSLGCDPGYQSSGRSSLTCRRGSWSTLTMICKKRNCGSAGEVYKGDIEYPEGTLFGAVLQVRCNPGYKRVGGTRVMRCDVRGWNGRLPECEAVVCEGAPAVEHANVRPVKESYQYRDSIKYTCLRDYTLIGQASLTCSEDGTFTPDPPECINVNCDEPVIKNGGWNGGARPPYTYLSTVILKCEDGYQMEGGGTITCEKDNNWSPQLPTCKHVQCAEPVIKNGGWDGGAQPPYTYKSTVILKCDDGYQMEGDGTITCEKDNNWSPQLPTCKLISTTPQATTTTTTPSTTTTTTSPKKPGVGGRDDDLKPEVPDNGSDSIGKTVGIVIGVLVHFLPVFPVNTMWQLELVTFMNV
ncbi:hypothetical protein INR49_000054, partial [Caranx melampygus]